MKSPPPLIFHCKDPRSEQAFPLLIAASGNKSSDLPEETQVQLDQIWHLHVSLMDIAI